MNEAHHKRPERQSRAPGAMAKDPTRAEDLAREV
jgi:hypothetical protein